MHLHSVILSLVAILFLQFQKSISMDRRVVGGSSILITRVPFMLSLRRNGAHICGAAIVSKNWGLTAAHCVTVYGIKNQNYTVRSGSSYRNKGGKIHKVTRIIWHELYNDLTTDYDIAVFKVERPFKFGKTTRAIKLPGDQHVDDEYAAIAGWGYFTALDGVLSEDLQYVVVPKVDRNKCSADYAGRFELTPQQVCYGYEIGGKDACKGDSGGPLFTNSSIIIGITSWGDDCAEVRLPGVYTTIFLMLDWIHEKTGMKRRRRFDLV